MYESEIAREQAEIDEDPHEELLELELFYQLKGFPPKNRGRWRSGCRRSRSSSCARWSTRSSGSTRRRFPTRGARCCRPSVSTAIGGFIPIIPFFFTVGMPAVIASFIISTIAHFVVGASKSLVTTRSWWASGAEMTVVGVIEAAITYGLGVAFAGH